MLLVIVLSKLWFQLLRAGHSELITPRVRVPAELVRSHNIAVLLQLRESCPPFAKHLPGRSHGQNNVKQTSSTHEYTRRVLVRSCVAKPSRIAYKSPIVRHRKIKKNLLRKQCGVRLVRGHINVPQLSSNKKGRETAERGVCCGGGGYSFVACLDHLTINHASISRRSTATTSKRDTSNI